MVTHTVSVELSFPLSSAKAAQVLERWWVFKGRRKLYMRAVRSGAMKPKSRAAKVSRETVA